MLFTDATWAEANAFRKAIAQPYVPWRCVGWTDEVMTFWIFQVHDSNLRGSLPDGLLVVGPEMLVSVIDQLSPNSFSVYVMRSGTQESPAALLRLAELWCQKGAGANTTGREYWYRTEEDEVRPCSRVQQFLPNHAPLELVYAGGRN
ncbi:hypothetical protein CBA19CS22_38990 [Caballeronia novacaledonica]|uniref:Uncharacterized protein n=1 Tax=Caballeronia novacaledonica TaxID=1544861 RepID=A0ACB5R643_9BURK|nr:hypothetical protein [Caballeronia sp. LZ029]MDR5746986.1 hypothetical protein [Caballeronia sp. LZ029]GJH22662.1 hypothetical protein CBA19CS22_38990 [Caballeronia novacaledonica]